ncbi:FxSxx-COOH system tetratricopeptide repeat protein [Saccharopolyspora sp. 5N708]|uniref:FxSxx-COOH system tetratricopeptide repeat protein n=1 Tax=Saccharopolyspora sp. 5N708 TaxID=3457424 RepID=UPI003FD20BC1
MSGESNGRRPATIVAFTSPTVGIGRTGVVANLAWVLAGAGLRVGVADWGTEAPRVHDYLRPFLAETMRPDELLDVRLVRALSVRRSMRTNTFSLLDARRYELPEAAGRIDVAASTDPSTPVPGFGPQQDGTSEVAMLREAIRAAHYDYVLIDGPTDMDMESLTRLARLCDVVAVCFTPRRSSVEQAVAIAQGVWDRAPVGVRIIGVPLQFDDGDEVRAQRAKNSIKQAFATLLGDPADDGRDLSADLVEIPWQPHHAYEETLAALTDDPDLQRGPLAAYQRLATAITQRQLDPPPEIPDRIRESYRRVVGLGPAQTPERIFLAYAPADRPWADWARDQLERAGAQVERLPVDAAPQDLPEQASALVLASARLSGSPLGRQVFRIRQAVGWDVVVLPVSDDAVLGALGALPRIRGNRSDEADLRARLLTRFSLVDRPGPGQPATVRFPGAPGASTGRSDLAPRSPDFVGRDHELEAMRDHFCSADAERPWMLRGEAGVGKSELAKEYAHRFAFDYDWVWWIPAHSGESVRNSLIQLAGRMRSPAVVDSAADALQVLSAARPVTRWLLVYDGADDPSVLDGLLPEGGPGHVIITTRAGHDSGEVGTLRTEDSIALLQNAAPDLDVADAARIAELVGRMPLTLRLTAAWLREAVTLLTQHGNTRAESATWAAAEFEARFGREAVDDTVPAAPGLAETVNVVLKTLREDRLGQVAVRAAELCVFLSPDGVALRLLRSGRLLAALSDVDDKVGWDTLELDRVLWRGARFGLFDLDWRQPPTLRIHRVVKELIGHLMTPEQRQARQADVLHGLAAVAPTDAEGEPPERMREFAELQKHLVVSGALHSTSAEVRRWVVEQVRYLQIEGGPDAWRFAIRLGNEVLVRWMADKTGDPAAAGLRMRLRFLLANLHRSLGRQTEALEHDQDLLAEQRHLLGATHPRTLKTARGLADGLRSLARFDEAVAEDQTTLRGFRAELGDDHPDTLRAANNLAHSLFLVGNVPAALALQEENRDRRLALFGPDHPDVWWSAGAVGIYLRELGRYAESLAVLREALDHILAIRPPNHPDELRIQRNRAIALRRSGDALAARDRDAETLQRYRELYGEDHPNTRACKLGFAADHHGTGDSATAAELGHGCLREYQRILGAFHPFTLMCQVDHAVFSLGAGDVEQALSSSRESWEGLRGRLGEAHPWTLAAAINQARALAHVGEVDSALALQREAYENGREFLVRDHPYTLVAAANLASNSDQWQEVVLDVPTT